MKKILVAFTALTVMFAVPALAQVDLKKGKKTFKKCASCHSIGQGGKIKVGPPLENLIGRTAGTFEGYKYSKAMKAKGAEGLVWNEETLAQFLKKPRKFIKGTKMGFGGLKDKKMANLIGYLKSYSKPAE